MKKIIIFCLAMLVPGLAWSNQVDTYGIGSKAAALGGAYSAYADSPFAAYYNPAGLCLIGEKQVSAGIMVMDSEVEAEDYAVKKDGVDIFGPADFKDESDKLYTPHMGFAMPLTERVGVGLAMYVPFKQDIEWDETADPDLNPGSYNSYDSSYSRAVVTPAMSFSLSEKLALGIGISLGRTEYESELNEYSMYPLSVAEEVDLEDDFNYSINLGLMYKPVDRLTLGLAYRSQAEVELDGDFEITGLNETEIGILNSRLTKAGLPELSSYKFDASLNDLDHPDQIQAGVKYDLLKSLSLEGDLVWTNWSIMEKQSLKIKGLDPAMAELLGGDKLVDSRDWDDTVQFKLGLEWTVNELLDLRGGYFYAPSPVSDDSYDLVWPDLDKHCFSLGFGLNWRGWTLDGVLQYAVETSEDEIDGDSANLNNSYKEGSDVYMDAKTKTWGYGMTLSYAF